MYLHFYQNQVQYLPKVGTVSKAKCARMHVSAAVITHWTGNGNSDSVKKQFLSL